MLYRQNLHTHNHYCDGRGTLEEFVLAAIDQGLEALGFSCHSSLENMERFIKAADGAIEFCQINHCFYSGILGLQNHRIIRIYIGKLNDIIDFSVDQFRIKWHIGN